MVITHRLTVPEIMLTEVQRSVYSCSFCCLVLNSLLPCVYTGLCNSYNPIRTCDDDATHLSSWVTSSSRRQWRRCHSKYDATQLNSTQLDKF